MTLPISGYSAIMTTPEAFFEQFVGDTPREDEPVTCDTCGHVYTDWNSGEYIGWNGQCVSCDIKEWEGDGTWGGLPTLLDDADPPGLFEFPEDAHDSAHE